MVVLYMNMSMAWKNKVAQFILRFWAQNKRLLVFCIGLSLPIVLYSLPLMLTGEKLAPGDGDYLMQTIEAARISILDYGQFPWWNPWVDGGVPLFANPQFGLISIPTLFGLLFGAVLGYKIALTAYLILGFWGLYLLFTKSFNTPKLTAILLGYVWTFGSFFTYRAGGHYTFFTIEFFPLLLFIFLQRKKIKYSWLWLGLVLGLMINAAAHNTTVMALAVFGLFLLVEVCKITFHKLKSHNSSLTLQVDISDLGILLKAGGVMLLVAGARLLYSLEYIREYPRNLTIFPEESVGILKAIFAMFGPVRQYVNPPSIPNWSWMEVSAYIGLLTGFVAILCFIVIVRERTLRKSRGNNNISPLLVLIFGLVFFLLGLGQLFGTLSPYNLLGHLPIFSEMRVASRWIVWASLMTVVFIALYNSKKYRSIINGLLLVSVCELFIFGTFFRVPVYSISPAEYIKTATINQQIHFDNQRNGASYDENLTATTRANVGQVIAGDALIDTRNKPPFGMETIRCDSDMAGCSFIMSKNAFVKKWSPTRIELERTAPGPIKLNMNPGKYWLINNEYVFTNMRIAEPDKEFVVTNETKAIEIKLQPKYSFEWLVWKISKFL